MRSNPITRVRIERDPLGEVRVPADAYYGVQTAARRRELPDQRPDGARASSSPPRFSSRRPRRRPIARSGRLAGRRRRRDRRRRRRGPRGQAPRSVRRRRLSGRRRHVAQHERERGARQPRRGDPRRAARGTLHARAPQRSRQHGPVDQRRLPDGDAAGAAARRAPIWSPRRAAWPRRSTTKAGEFADVLKTGPHAPAGRRADHARPGVRRLRGVRSRRGADDVERGARRSCSS